MKGHCGRAVPAAAALVLSGAAWGQAPAESGKPAAILLLAPGARGRTDLSIAFARPLALAEVRARFATLAARLKEAPDAVRIEEVRLQGADSGQPASIGFSVAPPWIDTRAGTLTLAPLVRALGERGRVEGRCLVPEGFTYRGPARLTDDQGEITVTAGPGGLVFAAIPHAARPAKAPATNPRASIRTKGVRIASIGLIVLLAAGAAGAAFRLTRRWSGQ